MEKVIAELLKFSSNILELGYPILDNRINLFEKKYGIHVPNDFRDFVSQYNGISLAGIEVYGFDITKPESIENVYDYEHFQVSIPQYPHLIPFSPDGGGNFYCFDTANISTKGDCPIVFWVSNYIYSDSDCPETVNNNFLEWLQQVVIDWTLECYDYEGNEIE